METIIDPCKPECGICGTLKLQLPSKVLICVKCDVANDKTVIPVLGQGPVG